MNAAIDTTVDPTIDPTSDPTADPISWPTAVVQEAARWIWIKDDVGSLYAFALSTDSFLNYRYVPSPNTRGSALLFLDDVLFELGGLRSSTGS